MNKPNGLIVIISAPSAGGKTTIVTELIKRHPEWMRSISTTTRAPRPGEEDGRDYFFVKSDQFDLLKRQNGFLESAEVHQNQYGTPRKYLEDKIRAGKVIFLTIDVQGAKKIMKVWQNPASLLSIFIMPTSIDILRERLLKRNTETQAQIEVRLSNASQEMEQAGFYDFTVYNHSLDQTVTEIEKRIIAKV